MKLKNEVRIALVAIAGIVVLFFGMQFLKGLDIFSSEYPYLMKFSNISGLSASSPIYADGFRVGTVNSIDYDYNKHGDITVEVSINKEMQIPEGTSAEIVSDVLGNVQVNLILGKEGAARLTYNNVEYYLSDGFNLIFGRNRRKDKQRRAWRYERHDSDSAEDASETRFYTCECQYFTCRSGFGFVSSQCR